MRLRLGIDWLQRKVWLRNLLVALVMVAGCLYFGKSAHFNRVLIIQLIVLLLFTLPAFLLATAKGIGILVYTSLIWVTAPEIRRLADWYIGYYSPVSLISLLPLLVTGMLVIRLIQRGIPENKSIRSILLAFFIPFSYASALGLLLNRSAGLYSMLTAMAPLMILAYLITYPPSQEDKERFMRMYATVAVLVSIYGWIQYFYLPPWDLQWMQGARMVSLGKPEPMQFRVFSTLNSTGPLAVYLVSALIPMIVNRRWRGPFGLLGVLLVLSCLSTTLVRSAWITLIAGVLAYLLLSRGASRLKVMLTLSVITGAALLILPLMPHSEKLTDRVGTLGSLHEDNSFNARIRLALYAIPEILKQPLGMGYGSIGQSSSKLGNGSGFAGLGSVDNGYLGTFATYGLIGGLFFFRALWLYFRKIRQLRDPRGIYVPLALSTIFQLLVGFLFGGGLEGYSAVLFWIFTGFAFAKSEEDV